MSSLQDAVTDVLLPGNAPLQMLMPQQLHEGALHTVPSAFMHTKNPEHSLWAYKTPNTGFEPLSAAERLESMNVMAISSCLPVSLCSCMCESLFA